MKRAFWGHGVLLAGALIWAGCALAAEQRPKALLICVDGMDWSVLRPLLEKGRLPHIRRIVRGGVHGEIATVRPVLSPPVWTSVATGKRPEKHGVVDYFSDGKLHSSDLRKTKALWNILSERGKRVGVVGYLVTYPAETVNGVVVSDFFLGEAEDEAQVARQFANVDAEKLAYPASLAGELEPRWAWEPYGKENARRLKRFMDFEFDPSHDPPRAPGAPYGGDRQLALRLTLAWHHPRDESFVRIAERFLERGEFDLFVVYLTGIDAVGHEYWRYYDEAPGISEEDKRRFGQVVPRYYEYIDEVVGRLRRLAPGADVFVVSDHGMRRNPKNPAWSGVHRDVSVFMAAGPEIAPAGEVLGPADSVLDVAPTLLQLLGVPAAADMDGKVIPRIFRGSARAELPRIGTYDGLPASSRGSGVVPGPAERERLRALGYLDKRAGGGPRRVAAALAAVVLFIGLSAGDPGLPGLGQDEVFDTACYAMEIVAGLPRTPSDWSVEAFGRTWPLKMAHPYESGFFQIYWTAPFFLLGGISVETLRLSVVCISVGTLLLTYGFCRLWFTGRAAFAAVFLTAVSPAFVLWSRMGHQVAEVLVVFFGTACLFFFSLWHLRQRVWALPTAFFFWGLSLTATVKGTAILLAFPAAFALCVPRRLWPGARLLAAGAAAAVVGAAPVIGYEFMHGFPTAARLLGSLAAPTLLGVDNAAFLGNFAVRVGQVGALLSGRGLSGPAGGPDRLNLLMSAVVAGSFIFLAARGLRRGGDRMSRLLVVLPAALLAATCFTPMGLHPAHVLVIWPLTCVAVAAAADGLVEYATALGPRAGRLAAGVVAVALVTIVALDLRVVAGFHGTLARTGGVGIWSDGIYALARHLQETGGPRPVCLTWGLSRNVYFLTRGRVVPLDGHNFRGGVDARLRDFYRESLRDPAVRYVLLAEDVRPNQGMVMGYYEAIRREARSAGLRLTVEKEFTDRAGRPVFQVARTERL